MFRAVFGYTVWGGPMRPCWNGARRFRAVIQLILRNKDNGAVEPYSIVITVANIDCQKDTRQVLEATVGIPLNESLKRIVGKFIFISPETISNNHLI